MRESNSLPTESSDDGKGFNLEQKDIMSHLEAELPRGFIFDTTTTSESTCSLGSDDDDDFFVFLAGFASAAGFFGSAAGAGFVFPARFILSSR